MEDLVNVILTGNYPRACSILRERKPFMEKGSGGWTPMHAAAWTDDYLLIQPLLRAGCSLTSFCDLGETPVHIAASSKWPRFLDKVLDPSLICMREDNESGIMPLHSAAAFGQRKAVKTLIGAGVDPDVRDLDGLTVMHYALIYEDQPEMIHTLAREGVPVDQADNADDETPLDYALQHGLFASANALIELGADRRRVKRGKLEFLNVPNAVGWAGVL